MATPDKIDNTKKDPLLWNPTSTTTQKYTGRGDVPVDLRTTNNTYNTLSFPVELGSDRYPYFMMIYVNASTKSKLVASLTDADIVPVDTTDRKVNQSVTSATKTDNLQSLSSVVQGAGNAVAGVLDVVSTSAANVAKDAAKNLAFEPVKKRLRTAVALPMPTNLSFSSDVGYKEASMGGFMGSMIHNIGQGDAGGVARAGAEALIQATPGQIGGAVSGMLAQSKSAKGAISGAMLDSAQKSVGEDFGNIMMKARGLAKNDRREQLFEGVNTRKFNFAWTVFPRSKAESETIHDIVKFLRFHMHPEIDDNSGGMNFIIPDEFDIEFHHFDLGEIGGQDSYGLPMITTCVLTSVHIDATPLGEFIAFDGTPHPVGVSFQMSFTELEPLTRKEIGLGY